MSTMKLTQDQWTKIANILRQENRPSVLLIRTSMLAKLGFLTRENIEWSYDANFLSKKYVYLDWYDERKRMMFEMKFSEEISSQPDRSYI